MEPVMEQGERPGRIVLVLGLNPDVSIPTIAGRAVRERRPLVVVIPGGGLSEGQRAAIHEVASLAWSWFDALSYRIVTRIEGLDGGDEVIMAVDPSERSAATAAVGGRGNRGPAGPLVQRRTMGS